MKKFILLLVSSLFLFSLKHVPTIAQAQGVAEPIYLDWSPYLDPSAPAVDPNPSSEGDSNDEDYILRMSEPMLIEKGLESLFFVDYSQRFLRKGRDLNDLTAAEKTGFNDSLKIQFVENVIARGLLFVNAYLKKTSKEMQVALRVNNQERVAWLTENERIGIKTREIISKELYFPEFGESTYQKEDDQVVKLVKVDPLKCLMHHDFPDKDEEEEAEEILDLAQKERKQENRYFYALVEFTDHTDQKILLKSLGLCQNFFDKYLQDSSKSTEGPVNNSDVMNPAAMDLVTFVMSLLGKSLDQARSEFNLDQDEEE